MQILFDDGFQVYLLQVDHHPAAQGQHVLNDGSGLYPGLLDQFELAVHGVLGIHLHQEQVRIADDAGQDIVQIMGHAGSQGADGFHFLGAQQLFFQLLPRLDFVSQLPVGFLKFAGALRYHIGQGFLFGGGFF